MPCANRREERGPAGREGPLASPIALQPGGSIDLILPVARRSLAAVDMEAITQPLHLVRQLYAARSEADGDEFGVRARFSALMADPQLGAQASVFQMPCHMPAGAGGPNGAASRLKRTFCACRCQF